MMYTSNRFAGTAQALAEARRDVVDDRLRLLPASDIANAGPLPAATLSGGVGVVSARLRTEARPLRLPLMYHFTVEYRAWAEVFPLTERTRSPMVLARLVLCRALGELYESEQRQHALQQAEADATRAGRRRRVWMTVNGERHFGVGADAERYRSIAVKVGDCLVVAVVPAGQETVEVRIATAYTNREQRRAIGEAYQACSRGRVGLAVGVEPGRRAG